MKGLGGTGGAGGAGFGDGCRIWGVQGVQALGVDAGLGGTGGAGFGDGSALTLWYVCLAAPVDQLVRGLVERHPAFHQGDLQVVHKPAGGGAHRGAGVCVGGPYTQQCMWGGTTCEHSD